MDDIYEVPQHQTADSFAISKLALRFRLTDAEYVGILEAAQTDVSVKAWVETFNIVSRINFADPRTKDGFELLKAKNLLTEERIIEIVAAPIQPNERP